MHRRQVGRTPTRRETDSEKLLWHLGGNSSCQQTAGLDPKIQTCHGLRKYFENALDDANIDHEKKMIIEGHFAKTRAKHYTDRDIEQLRGVYRTAYPFISLRLNDLVERRAENQKFKTTSADLEAQLERQRILEAKLTVLEDELDQMRQFRKRLER